MIELLMSVHREALLISAYGVLMGIGTVVHGLWPRHAYTCYPSGRYRLSNSDWKDGLLGIWMKVSTFRLIVCSFGLLLIVLGILCYPIIASAP
jgi:hypothetical protein